MGAGGMCMGEANRPVDGGIKSSGLRRIRNGALHSKDCISLRSMGAEWGNEHWPSMRERLVRTNYVVKMNIEKS